VPGIVKVSELHGGRLNAGECTYITTTTQSWQEVLSVQISVLNKRQLTNTLHLSD